MRRRQPRWRRRGSGGDRRQGGRPPAGRVRRCRRRSARSWSGYRGTALRPSEDPSCRRCRPTSRMSMLQIQNDQKPWFWFLTMWQHSLMAMFLRRWWSSSSVSCLPICWSLFHDTTFSETGSAEKGINHLDMSSRICYIFLNKNFRRWSFMDCS